MNSFSSLCLNMIVKNEAHVIKNTLENVCNYFKLDYWVICDTGSTDNTMDIIRDFFQEKKIMGELYRDEWKDFGWNRSLALERAYNLTDYLLIFDADDRIEGNLSFPQTDVKFDSFKLKFGPGLNYYRPLLINNKKKWKFVGVLHEYLECKETVVTCTINGDYYVVSGKEGNRSQDPEKYQKDALILENAYHQSKETNNPILNRYSFYCANSYRDANNSEQAIKWYKNTLSLDNWYEEKYCSSMYICIELEKLGKMEEALFYALKTFEYDKLRVEGIFFLIKYYVTQNQYEIAYSYYSLIKPVYENHLKFILNSEKLFLVKNYYTFYLPYYFIIMGFYLEKYEEALKMYEVIFLNDDGNEGDFYIKNLIFNLQFYIKYIKSNDFLLLYNHYILLLKAKNRNLDNTLLERYENEFKNLKNIS